MSYAIPIITCATVVIGGAWALYKGAFSIKEAPFISRDGIRINTEMKTGKTTVKQEEYEVFNIENILKEICDEPDRL